MGLNLADINQNGSEKGHEISIICPCFTNFCKSRKLTTKLGFTTRQSRKYWDQFFS